jgi:hypothetical protein
LDPELYVDILKGMLRICDRLIFQVQDIKKWNRSANLIIAFFTSKESSS